MAKILACGRVCQ